MSVQSHARRERSCARGRAVITSFHNCFIHACNGTERRRETSMGGFVWGVRRADKEGNIYWYASIRTCSRSRCVCSTYNLVFLGIDSGTSYSKCKRQRSADLVKGALWTQLGTRAPCAHSPINTRLRDTSLWIYHTHASLGHDLTARAA